MNAGPDESVPSNMCHQCQTNRGRIVRCENCTKKRFFDPYVKDEEPKIKDEKFSECCPLCCDACNCISCPRKVQLKAVRCDICGLMTCPNRVHPKVKKKIDFRPNDDQKVGYSIYILHVLVPILKRLKEEHIKEKAIESEIRGCSLVEVQLKKVDCKWYRHTHCICCKTSIFDLHRSCPSCQYDLCIQCCWELRDGSLQGNKEEVIIEFEDPAPKEKQTHEWKSLDDGRIPCPPKSMGGCGCGILELVHIKPLDSVSNLLDKAQKLLKTHKLEEDMRDMPEKWCTCSSDGGGQQLRKAASRENSNDNYLYCPRAIDIKTGVLKHFQWHWSKGEPVIVSNALETTLGLNAEPMVMSRAFHQVFSYKRMFESSTKFIEYREKYKTKSKTPKHDIYMKMASCRCLDWCEIDITLEEFFAWYMDYTFDDKGWPIYEWTEAWPLVNLLEDRLRVLGVEFISSLPFKEYTHPREGYLNLGVKLPKESLKPDMAPKIYIAYAINAQELERRDSVTKLHCEKADVVNVLVDIPTLTSNRKRINELKKKQKAQDQKELDMDNTKDSTSEKVVLKKQKETPGIYVDGSDLGEEGAVWDIFRREDTPKLQEYLKKHFREFKDDFGRPLQEVIHPIHDQTFYLTMEHKRKLKEEFGIEAWSFVQKLGDAVFIPAGCAHQVRNLKSCIKVAVNFVSPENIGECIRLTEDFRLLPKNNWAKEDTLEVKKIALHALEAAVEDLENLVPKFEESGGIRKSSRTSEEGDYSAYSNQKTPK
ncbi:lysine-specific demethylase JMJ25 isoform X2 [Lactuca sativa]|uniref:lysine-specific demethylase JMJ25 isoform X2 n=1 Tax=Lactuca sativa TaxID=4236 RepID=UPI001C687946|nr:lysine-specific demethylase JMJ25 isoform X2 [Lactuca sativa]